MNTYKIIFTREDGTQGTDHFTAINERQARKDFGECYRHSTATIISIELASTNTPATKQQERDTLEKIRKIFPDRGHSRLLSFKVLADLVYHLPTSVRWISPVQGLRFPARGFLFAGESASRS